MSSLKEYEGKEKKIGRNHFSYLVVKETKKERKGKEKKGEENE